MKTNCHSHYTGIINEEKAVINGALQEMNDAGRTNAHARIVSRIRDDFAKYFKNTRVVPWQWEKGLLDDF